LLSQGLKLQASSSKLRVWPSSFKTVASGLRLYNWGLGLISSHKFIFPRRELYFHFAEKIFANAKEHGYVLLNSSTPHLLYL